MLDNKKSYVNRQVEVFNTGFASVDNKICKIIGQFENERGGLIFELNRSNPKSKKSEPLCVKETNVKFV
jgi:hypothetical protein